MSGDCRSEIENTSTGMHKGLQIRRCSSCIAQLPVLRMAHQTSFISLAFLAFVLVSFIPNEGLAFPGSIDPLTNQACLPGVINKCGTGCSRCVCCGPDVSYRCFVAMAEHEIDVCVFSLFDHRDSNAMYVRKNRWHSQGRGGRWRCFPFVGVIRYRWEDTLRTGGEQQAIAFLIDVE